MKRKAILIEASEVPGETVLPGVRKTLMCLRDSCGRAGGDWQTDEIEILSNPSTKAVSDAIAAAKDANYSFVTFSGHGRHVKGRGVDETRVCLKDGELTAYELNTGTDRCTVVIDACRHVTRLVENVEMYARAKAASFSLSIKRGSRELFDSALAECEKGAIYLYSCDLDEAAGENTEGGFFSLFLVNGGENWYDAQQAARNQVYSMDKAFSLAAQATTKRQPQQHPQYQPGRRLNHFPFAVWIA